MNLNPASDEDKLLQAVQLVQQSNYSDAEMLVKDILRNNPRHPRALNIAGSIAYKVGKVEMALAYFNEAMKVEPHNSAIVANLGTCFAVNKETYDKAELCFRKALSLNPDDTKAICEYSILQIKMERITSAKSLLQHALTISDDYKVNATYGKVLWHLGDWQRSCDHLTKSITQGIQFDVVQLLISQLICVHQIDKAEEIIKKSVKHDHFNELEKSKLYVYAAIISQMKNDYDTFKKNLECAAGIKQLTEMDRPADITHQAWFSLFIYYIYLCFIMKYYEDESHGELLTSESDSVEALYLVGESHTLSSANTIVEYEYSPMQCQARLVLGVKVYHLCKEEHNYFKASFEEQFNALPKRSKIVVIVGEIDCRPDGGINSYYKKNPDIDLDQYIDGMIKNYVEFILSLAKQKNHTILFYGVPACKQVNVTISKNDGSTPETSEEDRVNQVEIIRCFNTHLQKYAKLNNCKFLDVYNYTNDMDGISSGIHHLDTHHLYPHVFRELL